MDSPAASSLGPRSMDGIQTPGSDLASTPAVTSSVAAPSPITNTTPGPSTETKQNQSRSKRARSSKADRKEAKAAAENNERFHCDYCGLDLSHGVRVRCAVCTDYDSCLDCFSVGAALFPHKPNHPYRLIQVCSSQIFQEGWGADEEEKMLEALEKYGVGNWEEVANVIGTKNPLETERHFMRVYLQSVNAPLPDPTKLVPKDKDPLNEDYNDVDPKALRVMHMHQQEDAAGWMSKRGDFVYEWDNEAEEILGDMEIAPDEPRREQDLKLSVLEAYCHKLDERQRRKDFVIKRGLTDIKRQQAIEKKRTKEERELREKLRVFARFLPAVEMDKFVKGLLAESSLRAQLQSYHEARLAGATTVEEAQKITVGSSKATKASQSPDHNPASTDSKTKVQALTSQNNRNRARKGLPTFNPEPAVGATEGQQSRGDIKSEGIEVFQGGSSGGASAAASAVNSIGSDPKDNLGKASVYGDVELEHMPGAELLSNAELALCTSQKMTPHQYLIVKDVIVRENARAGYIRKKDVRNLIRLDPTKVSKIFDYLSACGWIRHGASGVAARSSAANTSNSSKR